jgi:rhamnose transport system ATP-binding protein
VHAGEIVGLAGLVGAGRTELARTIFGIMPADEGAIRVRGVPVSVAAPRDAIRHGIAYLPEDRRQHGVVLDMAIAANMTLAALDRVSQRGTLNRHAETMLAADYTRRLGVRTHSLQTRVAVLSGGNQQKVALARWLATTPSVLILDEPTQGVDIGAKAEIHELITRLASEGAAILLISSELPEVIGMSDRVAVMAGGTIVRVLERDQIAQESILEAALQRTTV